MGLSGMIYGIVRHGFLGYHAYFKGTKRSRNKVTGVLSCHLKRFLYSPMSIWAIEVNLVTMRTIPLNS